MNWKIGNHRSTVVSDEKVMNTNFPAPPNREESAEDEIQHYGGYLVCESIGNADHAKLIAAAPDLLKAILAMLELSKRQPEPSEEEFIRVDKMLDEAIKKATA